MTSEVSAPSAAGIGTIEDVAPLHLCGHGKILQLPEQTHRGEADYGRHINAIVLT